jgi:hypothetical protein
MVEEKGGWEAIGKCRRHSFCVASQGYSTARLVFDLFRSFFFYICHEDGVMLTATLFHGEPQ